jgi:CRISPR-associated endonuclease/helicase Cas3
MEDPGRYFATLRRVRYEHLSDPLSWAEVASRIRDEPQALVVVNTKRDAMALLDALDDPEALHLSTLLCGAHRRDVLREVRHRLAKEERCRLISTQVVEAGVDLDFPTVFRAMGPLDRIVQAAGRCNREGRLSEGRVVVFEPKEGGIPRGAYRTGADTTRGLLRTAEFDFHNPAVYEHYFRLLYQARDLDEHGIQALRSGFDYPEVAARFRLIEEETVPVVVRYRGPDGKDATIDALLRSAGAVDRIPRAVFRNLQSYLVHLWAREVSAYERTGQLMPIRQGLWEWLGSYDRIRGLTDAPRDPEALVV